VPGSLSTSELEDLLGESLEIGQKYEAATVGGLVSEIEGRIPLPGEIVVLQPAGLRVEIVAATGHRVERVRIFPIAPAQLTPKSE
jgi:putative hemolysin